MRGFVAFGIEPAFSQELGRAASAFAIEPRLKPLPPTDYHVTIKFLSEFSSTDFVNCLDEICALGAPPVRSLRAGKLALWPTALVLECEATAALADWHSRINSLLEKRGFLKERHPVFKPHITLARRKPDLRLPEVEGLLARMGDAYLGREVPLEAPALWKSVAEETGRRHLPLLSPIFRRS